MATANQTSVLSIRALGAILFLTCAMSAEVRSQEPTLIEPRLDAFSADFRHSAASTKRRLLEDLRQELDGSVVSFRGSVWSLSEAKLSQPTSNLPNRGKLIFAWEYGGMIARTDYQVGEPAPPIDRIRSQLGGANAATLIIFRNGSRQVYALSADPQLIDQLRTGLDVEVAVRISGMTEESLFGFLEDVAAPPSLMNCACGRQFPSENGFRFCPFCGEALTPADEPPTSSTQIE